jgi:hypothetical protein
LGQVECDVGKGGCGGYFYRVWAGRL